MKLNYSRIGDFIERTNVKNKENLYSRLLGINIDKYFMPSVANVVGTDLSKYKIVKPGQFSCNRMHVGRDYRLPIAISKEAEPFIVSPAYDVFEITKPDELLGDYLMMWFSRAEFDRNTWFYTDTDVRGKLGWDSFCDMTLPIPPIEEQKAIVVEYQTVTDRIQLNDQLNAKLEETAQAFYRHWFVDFEFPDEKGKPYKSSGGKMVWNEELEKEVPEGWDIVNLDELFILQRGFDLPTSKRIEGSFPIYASTGISSYHNEYKVEPPGVVTGRSGSLGKVFFVTEKFWALNTTLWVKQFKKANPAYAFFYLSNMNISEYRSGSAVPTLNRNHIHMHRTFSPPSNIQDNFQTNYLIIKKKINELKVETEKCNNLKSLLLSKMANNKSLQKASAI